ncbi:MAG: adenylyl-sulfate kinase [Alphaproteobacteria bacterium]
MITLPVDVDERRRANGHYGGILWLTGLSGAGKTTLAVALERHLFLKGWQTCLLDGDNLRHGINADLGFSPEDRAENVRRVGEIGALFAASGAIAIVALISPYRCDRDRIRKRLPTIFHEVFVDAKLEECERRDPKGFYRRARAGIIPEFTGVSAPYEPPERPELVIPTACLSIDESVVRLAEYAVTAFSSNHT